jgi:WD40 repeat-containing protein SMU1
LKTTDCLSSFGPTSASGVLETTIQSVVINPKNIEEIFVCARSPTLYLMNLKGKVLRKREGLVVIEKVVKTFKVESLHAFVCCTVSPKGDFLYAVTEDYFLHCFSMKDGKEVHMLKVIMKVICF